MIIINIHKKTTQGEVLWSGILLVALARSRRHHFSPKHLKELVERGFATISDTSVILHTEEGDRLFNLDHEPGCYCQHCGESLTYEWDLPAGHKDRGAQARAHVAEKHAGAKPPNPDIPSGYKLKTYYGVTADDSVPMVSKKASARIKQMKTQEA